MEKLPEYPWFDQAPEHYKTRRQLADLDLRPGGPIVAHVVWRKGKKIAYLYDLHAARPKQAATAAQLAALDKARAARRSCFGCGKDTGQVLWNRFQPERDCPHCYQSMLESDRARAAQLSRAWLRSRRSVILDSETTSLDGYLVELAIIRAHDGAILLDTRINPQHPIDPVAQSIHGISADQLQSAPTFADLASRILELLAGQRVIAYNAAFDHGILVNELRRLADGSRYAYAASQEALRRPRWRCAMEEYAAYCGDWSDYHQSYTWQRLPTGDHSALGDCRATLAVLERMAA
jgi:DNA polymerase-3 subunit epsilon